MVTTAARADISLQFGPPYLSTGGFLRPFGLAVDDAHGRLLVADTGHNRFKWTDATQVNAPHTYTEFGFVANPNAPDALVDPQALAADASGNVYVVNTLAGNVKWYAWNNGNYQTAALLCPTNAHTVAGVDILMPRDIAVGPGGAIYLLDSGNKRILKADGPNDPDWSVFYSDSSWNNPYGLTVDANGVIFVADTGNHRVVKIANGTTAATWGHFGIGTGEFRFPRDVAVDQNGRVYVADTYNHRISILASDGHPLINLGHAPAVGTLDKVVVDKDGRLFAVDSDNNLVLAFVGGAAPPPFDPFFRDYVGDPGAEPSDSKYLLATPDVLVRHQPDVDIATATANGLESYAFQQPLYDQNNYVYIALHNRGTQPAADNFVKLFWYDPGSPQMFPADWNGGGFFTAYSDATHNTPGNTLAVPLVSAGGVTVAGPLVWRPPAPESTLAGDGVVRLAVRVTNPYDYPPTGNSTTMPRDSNNVAERPVTVIRGPFSTGTQNTLFVRVHFSDIASVTDPNVVDARATALAAWINEVSFGEANVTILKRGPVTPPQPQSYYAQPDKSFVIELAQDVLNLLLQSEPTLLDGSGPGHEIGRVVLITNDLTSTKDVATTGNWPYTVNSVTRYLTVSVQGGNNPDPLFFHGMSHQLGLVDLYAYENVTFSRPYVDGWDNMATPMNGVHPLVWSKEHAYWVTSHNAKILYIPRPAPGGTWNNGGNPVGLNVQTTAAAGQTVAVAFGLTNGVTSFVDETAFYYVEARAKSGADAALPQAGVVMYYANTLIPQGQGPVILRDHVAGGTLNDAAIPIGGTESPAGTGISVLVQQGTNGADYNLALQYNPPVTDYDVYMHPGDPPWTSPDIWVDNQKDGYDLESGRTLEDRGNQGIAGEENRIYARVYNSGPADAHDVEVAFLLSEPWHTVGGADAFDEFKSVFVDTIPSGQNVVSPYVTWTPKTGVSPHTCARVELRRLFNDTNGANNYAQRNLQIDHSEHGSPYSPVDFPFQISNGEKTAKLIYFRADGVPKDWTWSINPPKAFLAPGASASAVLKLQPPQTAPDCTSHKMYVTGWAARGDTLVRLGGVTVTVELQRHTRVEIRGGVRDCQKGDAGYGGESTHSITHVPDRAKSCLRFVTAGCTNPPQRNQTITVRYQGPDGKPVYHQVKTDGNGCFEDFNVVAEGGNWQADVEYDGDSCQGPATATTTVTVPLPTQPHPGNPDDRRLCLLHISQNVSGRLGTAKPDPAGSSCGTSAFDQPVTLTVDPAGSDAPSAAFAGDIVLFELRHILTKGPQQKAGFHRGRFEWKARGATVIGVVDGLTNIGTHHAPGIRNRTEPADLPNHWELSLEGVVVEGAQRGALVQAILLVDTTKPASAIAAAAVLTGTAEAVIVKDCDLTPAELEARLTAARRLMDLPPAHRCPAGLPCLSRISKSGEGTLVLDGTATTRCGEKNDCRTTRTWGRLNVKLTNTPAVEGQPAPLPAGTFSVERLLQITAAEERGEHSGTFVFVAGNGKMKVTGVMTGLTGYGTHRKPAREDLESGMTAGHWEGRLVGKVEGGKADGAQVVSRYTIQLSRTNRRRADVLMNLDGWIVTGCIESRDAVKEEPPATRPERPGGTVEVKPGTLPDAIFRPVAALPADLVARFKAAEGGTLTPQGEVRLRVADQQFRAFDRNGDQRIDKTEFESFYALPASASPRTPAPRGRPASEKSREEFKLLDTDHDGRLSAEELRNANRVLRGAEFDRADLDHDGTLDETEFALWFRTLPAMVVKRQ